MSLIDRLALLPLIVVFLLYPVTLRMILAMTPQRMRVATIAATNVLFLPLLIVSQTAQSGVTSGGGLGVYLRVCLAVVATYIGFIALSYLLLHLSENGSKLLEWSAFVFPLTFLTAVKYWPPDWDPMGGALRSLGGMHRSEFFVGVSYLAFRTSHLVCEVRNGVARRPTLMEYLAFALYLPGIPVGPITPYRNMHRSMSERLEARGSVREACLRILIGLMKYLFLATLLNQLTYNGLLLDGHPHARIDLLIAIPAYTLYLYCNFSGFCDMVIGVSALIGIDVDENFDRPFTARNLQEFWTRWHITLSSWFRDLMFTPLLKWLVRRFGPRSANPMTLLVIVVVFVVLGVWHGNDINFVIFGALQGVGVASVHYYRVILKRYIPKESLIAYQRSRSIRIIGSVLTFAYFSLSLFFFANNMDEIHRIAMALV